MKITKEQIKNFYHPEVLGINIIFGIETDAEREDFWQMVDEIEDEEPGSKAKILQEMQDQHTRNRPKLFKLKE